MASDNKSYVKTEDVELTDVKNLAGALPADETAKQHGYEEALDLTGNGKYNIGLLLACFLIITAMGIEIFGLGIIVTASACDLGMSNTEIGILSSMPFAGIIVMSYPWGYLSDTKGRKLVLMLAMGGSFVTSSLSSIAPNWQVLAVLRFLGSALCSAAESATYALLGECCSARVRARYMLLMTSALMLTPTLYYVWAYLILKLDFAYSLNFLGIVYRPWRLLTLVMALPLGLGALTLHFFRESPKFLANVGRTKEAIDVLRKIHAVNNGESKEYNVHEIYLEDEPHQESGISLWKSLWMQIAPLFRPPLLLRTIQLYYLTFVIYIANNSFAIVLPYIFNLFFTSYAASDGTADGFCDLFTSINTSTDSIANSSSSSAVESSVTIEPSCADTIVDNTIWAGCAHGLSFFVLNALIAQCANRRKALTITILVVAAIAAVCIDHTGEPIAGLVLFIIFLTTAMIFGVVSSYFVDLYPTSYRGMVACLGMMVARLSAFAGTNILMDFIGTHCSATLYTAAGIVLSGAVVTYFLPPDTL